MLSGQWKKNAWQTNQAYYTEKRVAYTRELPY
jgi:hypothetical protein